MCVCPADKTLCGYDVDPIGAPASEALMSLQVIQTGARRAVLSIEDRLPRVVVTDCKQNAHRLGSRERQIESRVARRTPTTSDKRLARDRRAPGQKCSELPSLGSRVEAKRLGSTSDPLTGYAAALFVVVIAGKLALLG